MGDYLETKTDQMFIVKTQLKESRIEGVGVFADEPIKKGQLVWRFHHGFDSVVPAVEMQRLCSAARLHVERYAYRDKDNPTFVILCAGHGSFINHSDGPNLLSVEAGEIASRDIEPGEELTCDYRAFDADFDSKDYEVGNLGHKG